MPIQWTPAICGSRFSAVSTVVHHLVPSTTYNNTRNLQYNFAWSQNLQIAWFYCTILTFFSWKNYKSKFWTNAKVHWKPISDLLLYWKMLKGSHKPSLKNERGEKICYGGQRDILLTVAYYWTIVSFENEIQNWFPVHI